MVTTNGGPLRAPETSVNFSPNTATVAVGETIIIDYTSGFSPAPLSSVLDTLFGGIATTEVTGGTSGTVAITGVSTGTASIAPSTPLGNGAIMGHEGFTLTVTAPADDQNFLNERGLARFWNNIDDIKQDKLTAGAGISITGNTISATGGGTADAVDWGNITGSMSNQTDLMTALNAKANTADLATVATSGDYDDLTDKPTIGNATLTIQKNGTSAGTFTANATSNKTINITVPTAAADVSALPASTKYGASIAVSINTTDYKVTTTLKDQDGNTLGTAQVIDLPLESVVVNGSYDNTNKKIVLTLQNGNTIDIPVADLVAGLQSEITSSNKLSSDLVDDTNHTHKFMTSAEKTKLSGIAAGAEVNVQSDWNQTTTTADDYIKNKPSLATVATSGSYNDLSNKPTIPTVNNATLTIQKNGTTVKTFTANASSNVTANITVPTKTSDITNDSNFVASGDLATVATSGSYNDLSNKPTIPAAQVQSNWAQTTTTAVDYIKNKPTLATVATSGSYNDLSDKPAIPAKQVFYGTCDSSGRLSNKTVACSGFTYAEGNVIYVTFSDADTYSGDSIMTMNVNSTGAKIIFTQTTSGGGLQSDYKWAAGETVCFVCHDDYYLMVEAAMATPTTSGLMSVNDKNKLDGIAAGAEANVQANWAESDSSSDAYIQNKPSLATVATSGSYDDLSNKPTIPAAQVNSDWNASSGVAQILNKPTIPTVNNATLTIQKNGTTVETFTANASSDATANITVPINVSDLTNDAGYLTSVAWGDVTGKPTFAAVATSGSYNDLSSTPTIPTVNDATLTIQQNGTDVQTFTANQSTNATANITVPTATSDLTNDGASGSSAYVEADELATVATTGNYSDLSGTPTIPTVNNATLTIQKNGSNVQTFTANQSTNATANITVPTKTSELTNNSGFLTSVATANIANKAVTTAKLAAGIVTMTRTVLYNNASGTTGNITVSQALNKFDEVEFWFKDSNGTPSQLIRTIPGDALAIVLDIPHPGGSNTVYWNLARWYWTAGSTTLSKWGSHYEKALSTTISTSSADNIKIRKIVGIKFVSN